MNYATIAQFVIFEINVGLYLVYSKLLSLIIPKGHFFYKSDLKIMCARNLQNIPLSKPLLPSYKNGL